MGRLWMERTQQVLFVNDAHDAICLTACLDSILSFDTQGEAMRGTMDRQQSLACLDSILVTLMNGAKNHGVTLHTPSTA